MSEDQKTAETVVKAFWQARDKMLARCGKIGEPAIYLPIDALSTFVDNDGEVQVIIGMTQFICLVQRILEPSP